MPWETRIADARRMRWWVVPSVIAFFVACIMALCVVALVQASRNPPLFVPLPTPTSSPHAEVPTWQRVPDGGVRPQ